MEVSHQRAERLYVKLSLGALVGLIAFILLIWGGRKTYVYWQERRLVHTAQVALDKEDLRTASLAARTVLQLKPSSTGANRIVARLADRAGDKSALDWWGKVVKSNGHTTDDFVSLARSALQFNDATQAEQALGQVPPNDRGIPSYHAVAALLAQTRHNPDLAEQEWQEAARLDPAEHNYALQLGTVKLQSSDPERREAGRRILKELQSDPKYRGPATRALLASSIANRAPTPEILELAHLAQSYPEANTRDRITYLDILRQANDSRFTAYLTELENKASSDPAELADLLNWMSQSSLNVFAADYLKTVAPEQLAKWPAPLAASEVYTKLKDWRKLESATRDGTWPEADYLREAYLSRALREQNKMVGAEHEWAAAVRLASPHPDSSLALARTISEWGWDKEALEVLWEISKNTEKRTEALQTLYVHYAKHRDTQGLFKVLVRLHENEPDNLDIRNNYAQVSLLLNVQREDARRMASEVYQQKPGNAAYATTYAYGLLTAGKTKEALAVMSKLSPEQLRDPAISAYYGICLAAAKDARADEYLELGKKAPRLLPEEQALIDKAEGHIIP
jgi:thioredoxin-like negative regulator of GroEL